MDKSAKKFSRGDVVSGPGPMGRNYGRVITKRGAWWIVKPWVGLYERYGENLAYLGKELRADTISDAGEAEAWANYAANLPEQLSAVCQ